MVVTLLRRIKRIFKRWVYVLTFWILLGLLLVNVVYHPQCLKYDEEYFNSIEIQESIIDDNVLRKKSRAVLKSSLKTSTRDQQRLFLTNSPKTSVVASKGRKCYAPENHKYPLCRKKLKQFKKVWNEKCHGKKFKINASDPCSILVYLSEVEPWCPLLPWRKVNTERPQSSSNLATLRTDIKGLNKLLKDNSFAWMRMRAQSTWTEWVESMKAMETRENFKKRKRQKIIMFLGGLDVNPVLVDLAFRGGPLGEFVQWTDLICSLYILGHDLVISSNGIDIVEGRILTKHQGGCAVKDEFAVDRIFTDLAGIAKIRYEFGPTLAQYRCKVFILDSFGTEAEFNYMDYPVPRNGWGNQNLLLRQFMTMYPHSPDNLFLGFAIPKKINRPNDLKLKKKLQGLIYAKSLDYFKGKEKFLDVLHKHIELHGNVGGEENVIKKLAPKFLINHGILNNSEWMNLLMETKVFIGLGFPFEGPAPLDAIANGCFYINPKVDPPLNRDNSLFFEDKPTKRKITSQNPYTEDFIGKPFVHTIDINNITEVENTIREILASKDEPHLPYQFTIEGMLQRVNHYVENLDFCNPNHQWPPRSEMKVLTGQQGESCKDLCFKNDLICEPAFFHFLNKKEHLTRAGLNCKAYDKKESLYAPLFNSTDQTCILQDMPLLYSCVSRDEHVRRICPCRTYQKEQVAFYKN